MIGTIVTITYRKTGYTGTMPIPDDRRRNCTYTSARAGTWPYSHHDAEEMLAQIPSEEYEITRERVGGLTETAG